MHTGCYEMVGCSFARFPTATRGHWSAEVLLGKCSMCPGTFTSSPKTACGLLRRRPDCECSKPHLRITFDRSATFGSTPSESSGVGVNGPGCARNQCRRETPSGAHGVSLPKPHWQGHGIATTVFVLLPSGVSLDAHRLQLRFVLTVPPQNLIRSDRSRPLSARKP